MFINRTSYFIKQIQNWKDTKYNVLEDFYIILLVANTTSRQNNNKVGKFINFESHYAPQGEQIFHYLHKTFSINSQIYNQHWVKIIIK